MSAPTVFISYSHDSDQHREQVLALSERLRDDGITTVLDQYVNGSPEQGWPRWMMDQLDAANSVLVVCTATYYRRFRGHESPGVGKGVDWEGALITQEIYDSRSRTLKFLPVLLSDATADCIPEPLRSGNQYRLTSEEAYQRLYDALLHQSGVEAGPIGTLKTRPRRRGAPLAFDAPPSAPPALRDSSDGALLTSTDRKSPPAPAVVKLSYRFAVVVIAAIMVVAALIYILWTFWNRVPRVYRFTPEQLVKQLNAAESQESYQFWVLDQDRPIVELLIPIDTARKNVPLPHFKFTIPAENKCTPKADWKHYFELYLNSNDAPPVRSVGNIVIRGRLSDDGTGKIADRCPNPSGKIVPNQPPDGHWWMIKMTGCVIVDEQ